MNDHLAELVERDLEGPLPEADAAELRRLLEDASLKQAVNGKLGKNLIGCFHAPVLSSWAM